MTAQRRPSFRRLVLLACAFVSLIAALWAGLLRMGWGLPALRPELTLAHGPLMVCGFLGTLIGLERAVALGRRWAYTAPVLTGVGALGLIGDPAGRAGPLLITLGSVALLFDFAAIIVQTPALFTVTMSLGALAWLVGNSLWLGGSAISTLFLWWAGFLVLTIAGERLELSRMVPHSTLSQTAFMLSIVLYVAGLLVALVSLVAGLRTSGAAMTLLALWLLDYDVARRTVKQAGLPRFIAVNLIAGYSWLGVSGALWFRFAGSFTTFGYDAVLHSLFLGFVFSMIFAHAPIIFPAVLGRPLQFRRRFYVHSALLHFSLFLRIAGDLAQSSWAYDWGGLMNVLTLLVFVANTMSAVLFGAPGEHEAGPNEDRQKITALESA